ncbi:MAG: hypothetical protein WBG73_12775 [Coleofasciculaceae cyanobacterium]
MDVQSIKDWFKNLPPQNIGLALLAILFIAFAGSKGLEIISNLTKDSSSSNPISKESSSPASKTPDLENINIIVQERESLKPIEGVEIEYIVEGPSVRKYTDRNGQRGISIPSTRAVEITLRKRGFKTAPDTINLQVDPKKTKTFYLEPEPSQPRLNQSSMLVPSTPASNSSPSPKPTQQNLVESQQNLGRNLIENPGFEEGFTSWEQNNQNNAEHKLESGYKSSQAACSIQKALSSQTAEWVGIKQTIEVKADQKYRFQARLSWENAVEVHLKVIFLGQPSNTSQVFNSGKKSNSGGWVLQGESVTAPKNTVSALIVIWHGVLNETNVANSKLCIDDVVFAPIGN